MSRKTSTTSSAVGIATRALPPALALYIMLSAKRNGSLALSAWSGKTARPIEPVPCRRWPPASSTMHAGDGAAHALGNGATASRLASGRMATNSSPP